MNCVQSVHIRNRTLHRSSKIWILPNRSYVLPVNMRCTLRVTRSQYKLCNRGEQTSNWFRRFGIRKAYKSGFLIEVILRFCVFTSKFIACLYFLFTDLSTLMDYIVLFRIYNWTRLGLGMVFRSTIFCNTFVVFPLYYVV